MEHNGNNWTLAQQMEEAFNLVGSSMMSDEFACKLLAFTGVLGGEITVLHTGLNAGIAIAAQKLRIKGGETPRADLLPMLQQYIKEMNSTYDQTPWIIEIYQRYEIEIPKNFKPVQNAQKVQENTEKPSVQGQLFEP